jgi:selenophosphate synthetase-related protein
MDSLNLADLAKTLRESSVFANKCHIRPAIEAFNELSRVFGIQNGDDAAAIPDGDGYLLLAAEGIVESIVRQNPYLAGLSAVLANVNDIYAMGGRPLAMVDVLGAPAEDCAMEICRGMRHNATRFRVPIVGGHVLRNSSEPSLAVAILGRAKKLITSFDANPGDRLVLVSNPQGQWLDMGFWNCTLERYDADLVPNLELLPQAAEAGGCYCRWRNISRSM